MNTNGDGYMVRGVLFSIRIEFSSTRPSISILYL